MSKHVNTQALTAIKEHLKLHVTSVENRVFRRLMHQAHDRYLPCIVIELNGDQIDDRQGNRSNAIHERRLSLNILAITKSFESRSVTDQGEALEDELLEMSAEIEAALMNGLDSDLIHDVSISGGNIEHSEDSDRPLGALRIGVQITIRNRAGDPRNNL